MSREVSVCIVGSGGDGAVSAGDIIASACAKDGLHVIKTEAYGPQIRGGESSSTVRISATPIQAPAGALDAIVVFKWGDYARFSDELSIPRECAVFYDAKDSPPENAPGTLVAVTFPAAAKNIFAVGLLAASFGLPLEPIRTSIAKRFAKKSAEVRDANLRAFDEGVALPVDIPPRRLEYTQSSGRIVMSGNEAVAYAALHAGCSFFAGYPITPSTEILQLLAEWLPASGGTCLQTEDELAAIGAVVGASFAGAKSMTATSGPGLSLMSEMIGLASIAEIPSVIVNVQRGGPSTGIPTKSEQSDLLHAVHGSHGDTPRVVLACCDVEDAFHTTVDAFNIAEEFQMPVIVLSDQLIAQRRDTIDRASLTHDVRNRVLSTATEEYRRYAMTENGVSPMSVPGIPGATYQTNGLEHDERGRPSAMYTVHQRMNAKRHRKMDAIAEQYGGLYRLRGRLNPDVGIICWGSSAGPVFEAVETLNQGSDIAIAAFVPRMLSPLPAAAIQAFVDSCQKVLVVELSYAAQFHQYLRSHIDLPRAKTIVHARSGGKALAVAEVVDAVRAFLGSNVLEESLV